MAKSNSNAAAVKGQKNLFSFFSKKPTATTASAASATKEVSSKSTTNNSAAIGAPSKNSNNDTSVKQQQQSEQHQNPTISRTSSNNNNNDQQQPLSLQLNKLLGKVTVGTKLAVYWPDDQEYYPCLVTRHRVKTSAGAGGDEGELYGVIDLFTMLFLFNFSYGVLIHYSLSSLSPFLLSNKQIIRTRIHCQL